MRRLLVRVRRGLGHGSGEGAHDRVADGLDLLARHRDEVVTRWPHPQRRRRRTFVPSVRVWVTEVLQPQLGQAITATSARR